MNLLSPLLLTIVVSSSSYIDDVWRATANSDHPSFSPGLTGKLIASRNNMTVYVSLPRDSEVRNPHKPQEGHPVVVVAHHAVGIYHATFLRRIADQLAGAGYVGVLPDFFHRVWSDKVPTGKGSTFDVMNIGAMLGSLKDSEVIEDLTSVKDLILAEADNWEADPFRIAVLGYCMGGRIAWLAGVHTPFAGHVRGIVAYHGGSVFKTWPAGGSASDAPAAKMKRLLCPVLGHFGTKDQNPSLEDMSKLKELSHESGQDVDFHTYDGAEHGFSCQDSVKYQEAHAINAWTTTLDFLGRMQRECRRRRVGCTLSPDSATDATDDPHYEL